VNEMNSDYLRTTITVPRELKQRMKQAGARVNWSAVACEAFEQKLEAIGPIKTITSIDDAVERMRSAHEQPASQPPVDRAGQEAGMHWALNFALPAQLNRIEALKNEMSDVDWIDLMLSCEGPRELAQRIEPSLESGSQRRSPPSRRRLRGADSSKRPAKGGGPGHRHPEREIWQSILDRRPESPRFFLGFADGALEIWKQIKDRLSE
jgi:hypothetical protein